MANPSLQIGNSNWAIKEDNLLGYSTAGTRFVPQPITMTRESAGTRVNSSGLVETVELLGSFEQLNLIQFGIKYIGSFRIIRQPFQKNPAQRSFTCSDFSDDFNKSIPMPHSVFQVCQGFVMAFAQE